MSVSEYELHDVSTSSGGTMRPRSVRSILALPLDDTEERAADRHIKAETAAIKAKWDDETFFRRQVRLPPGAWIVPVVKFIGTADGDGSIGTADDDAAG